MTCQQPASNLPSSCPQHWGHLGKTPEPPLLVVVPLLLLPSAKCLANQPGNQGAHRLPTLPVGHSFSSYLKNCMLKMASGVGKL